MYLLKKEDVKSLLSKWSDEFEVFSPQVEDGQVMLLPYEEKNFTVDYVNFAFPFKEYFFTQREVLFSWKNIDGHITTETSNTADSKKKIYFGIRPCDAYGISYMDKFFLEGYRDGFYGRKREQAYIVAINCIKPGDNCFCSSMGTGPFAEGGYDVLLTPMEDNYIVEAGNSRGEELIAAALDLLTKFQGDINSKKELVEKEVINKFKTRLITDNPGGVLEKNYNNPIWLQISEDCVACTGCTSMCPTCTCFNVVEERTGENSGARVRHWDSCQSDSFTRNAGEHNPRTREIRVKYRIYDKFKYIEDKFNYKGCTGCGRCINVCPASINFVKIINSLAENTGSRGDE